MATHATTATTSTFEYRIIKYSKSNSFADGPLQAPTAAEWQHFTNPTISLILDIRKSSTDHVESVRLRIVWVLDAGCNASNEIVFEDIDLLTFSSFPYTHPESIHGLPLKAVYRDAVVGIRYLHAGESGDLQKSPVYRRFQIVFETPAASAQFIESIESVCPCKLNPAAPTLPSSVRTRRPTGMPAPAAPARSLAHSLSLRPSIFPSTTPVQQQPSFCSPLPANSLPLPYLSPPFRAELVPTPSRVQHYSPNASQVSSSQSSAPSRLSRPTLVPSGPHSTLVPPHLQASNSSQVGSSQSSVQSQPIPRIPEPQHAEDVIMLGPEPQQAQDTLTEALMKETSLYNLQPSELEKLVGDIIQEDGFVRLLGNLDKLWNIKGFLGA